jgi:hypothetical protein
MPNDNRALTGLAAVITKDSATNYIVQIIGG